MYSTVLQSGHTQTGSRLVCRQHLKSGEMFISFTIKSGTLNMNCIRRKNTRWSCLLWSSHLEHSASPDAPWEQGLWAVTVVPTRTSRTVSVLGQHPDGLDRGVDPGWPGGNLHICVSPTGGLRSAPWPLPAAHQWNLVTNIREIHGHCRKNNKVSYVLRLQSREQCAEILRMQSLGLLKCGAGCLEALSLRLGITHAG